VVACLLGAVPSSGPAAPPEVAVAAGRPQAPPTSVTTPPSTSVALPPWLGPPLPQLPGGGRRVLPDYRLVGFSGGPGAEAFGRLHGDLAEAAAEIEEQAVPYGIDRPVLPVFELIATVVHATPGADGLFRSRSSDEVVRRHLAAAREAGALLLLNIQPGLAGFLEEVRAYEQWLREPDVGVALDPEWAVEPGEIPGEEFGSTTGAELDEVSAYLAGLVQEGNLPQKVMVYHQVAASVVQDETALRPRTEVAAIKSVDGIGSSTMKVDTWELLVDRTPPWVAMGFKLFYVEDVRSGPLMTPEEVLALRRTPHYVLYE